MWGERAEIGVLEPWSAPIPERDTATLSQLKGSNLVLNSALGFSLGIVTERKEGQ